MTWLTFDDALDEDSDHGVSVPWTITSSSATSATASSGYLTSKLGVSSLSTLWTTIYGAPVPSGFSDPDSDLRLTHMKLAGSRGGTIWVVWAHKVGTVTFNGTGNRFTHDACTFPLTRSKPWGTRVVAGWPLVSLTTATATTAPVIGSWKYNNQAGVTVTNSDTFTFPNATTAAGTGLMLHLEPGDLVTDITEINVTTAASAGAGTVYLLEPIAQVSQIVSGHVTQADMLRGSRFCPPKAVPPAPTSGTLDTMMLAWIVGTSASWSARIQFRFVKQGA